jgi:hypothetical protein
MQKAHCRDNYYREFAYKTISSDFGYPQIELRRVKRPLVNSRGLNILLQTFQSRPGQYVTVYSFSKLTEKRTIDYLSAKINRIYLDFDCKENPQKAIDEALLTIRSLTKHKIYPHFYFSGGKGIAMYIEFNPVDIAPENKKEVLKVFFNTVIETVKKDLNYDITTMDTQVRGDLARVSRLPNTKHAKGLYCIPVTIGDIKKGLEHIKELAVAPREDFDLEATIIKNMVWNNKLPHIIENIEKQVVADRQKVAKIRELKKASFQMHVKANGGIPGAITEQDIEKARSVPLSDYLGHDEKIICPFHNDSNPSLHITHSKGLWFCHGCSAKGDVISLVMKLKNVNFINAVKILLKR